MTTQWNQLLATISQLEHQRMQLTELIEQVQTSVKRPDLITGVAKGAKEMENLMTLYKSRQPIDESLAKLYGFRTVAEPRIQEALSLIQRHGQNIGLGVRVHDRYVLTALHCVADHDDEPYDGLNAFGSALELAGIDIHSNLAIFKVPESDGSYSMLMMDPCSSITPGQPVWLMALQPDAATGVLTCQAGHVLDFPETSDSAVVQYTEGTCQFAGAAVVLASGELAGIHTGFYDFSSLATTPARKNGSSGGSSHVASSLDSHMSVVHSETGYDEAAEVQSTNTQCKTVCTGLVTTASVIGTQLVCTGAMKDEFLELARHLRSAGR